eukprot:6149644-Pleurochrysis_carterae.AAC.4
MPNESQQQHKGGCWLRKKSSGFRADTADLHAARQALQGAPATTEAISNSSICFSWSMSALRDLMAAACCAPERRQHSLRHVCARNERTRQRAWLRALLRAWLRTRL